ncbi:MAG: hypothetical protein K1X53_10750 [Candidatus Sumerlaeaceae bacterium]|nr:hypothetical protein [Candidatus Sumerlaeaceae bacterium]
MKAQGDETIDNSRAGGTGFGFLMAKTFNMNQDWSLTRRIRGGATFTMLLMFLLLVSSGLMYFYYMRCRELQSELQNWRSGKKVPSSQPLVPVVKAGGDSAAGAVSTPEPESPPVPTPEPEMPAPRTINRETPAPRNVVEPVASETPAAREVSTQEEAAVPTPTPRSAASTPKPVIRSMYDMPADNSAKATPQPESAETPAVRVKIPKRNPTPVPKSDSNAGADDIGSFLQQKH